MSEGPSQGTPNAASSNDAATRFDAQQLASACSLMCREVRRVAALDPLPEGKTVLKEYVVAKAKWLLNLA